MRFSLFAAVLSLSLISCDDDSGTSSSMDLSMPSHDLAGSNGDMVTLPTLTVNNTLMWCTVTVTVGNGTPTSFTAASKSFMAASGTVIHLQAEPLATFMPVKWTGVTSSTDMASYTMTSAASQTVTACCAEANGLGC